MLKQAVRLRTLRTQRSRSRTLSSLPARWCASWNVAAFRAPVGFELEPTGGLGLGFDSWFGSDLALHLAFGSNLFESEGGLAWVRSRY